MFETIKIVFDVIINQGGITGALLVLFVILWIRCNRNAIQMARSFNRQIANLNDQRGKEIKLVAKALQANADNNQSLAYSLEKLRDFIIRRKLDNE